MKQQQIKTKKVSKNQYKIRDSNQHIHFQNKFELHRLD